MLIVLALEWTLSHLLKRPYVFDMGPNIGQLSTTRPLRNFAYQLRKELFHVAGHESLEKVEGRRRKRETSKWTLFVIAMLRLIFVKIFSFLILWFITDLRLDISTFPGPRCLLHLADLAIHHVH